MEPLFAMTSPEFLKLLAPVVPSTPEGADHLLDLREALLSNSHPGRCVRCFFGLLPVTDEQRRNWRKGPRILHGSVEDR